MACRAMRSNRRAKLVKGLLVDAMFEELEKPLALRGERDVEVVSREGKTALKKCTYISSFYLLSAPP